MQAYPHTYRTNAEAGPDGTVDISSSGLVTLSTAPPAEFGGPGDQWSPETLLVASVADCFILTFRAIARASKLDWTALDCDADGILDRVDGVTRFTRFNLHAHLKIAAGEDAEKADKILHKSEAVCLITASMNSEVELKTTIESA